MKYYSFIVSLTICISVQQVRAFDDIVDVRTDSVHYYLCSYEVPNSFVYLPVPPELNSIQFLYDDAMYKLGKSLRKTSRGKQALIDACVQDDSLAANFSRAFGYKISRTYTPEIFRLITKAKEDFGTLGTIGAKRGYARIRPYVQYNENTLDTIQQKQLINSGSYPSGHSAIGMGIAYILMEVNPDRAVQLLQKGMDFGFSRVVAGFHYWSDVEAGRLVAGTVLGTLHSNSEYCEQLNRAKEEFAKLKGKKSDIELELPITKEKATQFEKQYNLQILSLPLAIDDVSGYRFLYIRTNECDYKNAKAVDNVLLVDDEFHIKWTVKSLIRHDNDDIGCWFGVYVTNGIKEGEIKISGHESLNLRKLLGQAGSQPFINCTNIIYQVKALPSLIPFTFTNKREERFFGNIR